MGVWLRYVLAALAGVLVDHWFSPTFEAAMAEARAMNLSDVGSWASVAGLAVSLWLVYRAEMLARRISVMLRVPALARRLLAASKNLQRGIADNLPQLIGDGLGSINVSLEGLGGKSLLPENVKGRIQVLKVLVAGQLARSVDDRDPAECQRVRELSKALAGALENAMRDLQS